MPSAKSFVHRVNNGSPAGKSEAYFNRGAEIRFEGRTQIERQQVILLNDRELVAQLTSRRGWPDSKGRLQLEPKQDLRARNLPWPNRADAVLGALAPPISTGAFSAADLPPRNWGEAPEPAEERFVADRLGPEDF